MTLKVAFDKPTYAPTDPVVMTVTSDKRQTVTPLFPVLAAGESVQVQFITQTDVGFGAGAPAFVKQSDDGKTAVFKYTPPAS